MSNEIIKDELLSGNVQFLEGVQFSSQNKIFTDKEISKVLFVKSTASVLHTEILDEEVHVSGKILTTATFLSTSTEMFSSDAEMEFNETIRNKEIKQGDEICISASVIDCLVDGVSVSEIETTTIVELMPKLTSSEKISYVTGGGDGLYVLDEEFKNKFLVKSGKEEVELELEIPCREKAQEVLNSSCSLCVKNVKAKAGIVQIDFNASYSMLLKGEENTLKVINDESSLSEEIDAGISGDDSQICGKLNVISHETQIVEDKIIMKIKALFCFDVYQEKSLNFVSDAFSTTNEINLHVISALQNRFAYNFSENSEIVGNISVKDENFEIRKVIGALPKTCILSKVESGENEILIEGVASFTAIYESVDDELDSVDVEVPFVTNIKNPNIEPNQMLSVCSNICDVKTKIRKANEIELSAGINFAVNVFEKNEFAYVNDIEIGEEKMGDDSALTIYVVKENENLFGIAKKLSASIAQLKEQNPALEENLQAGTTVSVYKQKMVD